MPGHGGVFDRVDCQLIMGLATHTYYVTFINPPMYYTVAKLTALVASLGSDDQLTLYRDLQRRLRNERLIR